VLNAKFIGFQPYQTLCDVCPCNLSSGQFVNVAAPSGGKATAPRICRPDRSSLAERAVDTFTQLTLRMAKDYGEWMANLTAEASPAAASRCALGKLICRSSVRKQG
jgi:hypothetical protein